MPYTPVNWQDNPPSQATPLSAANLNQMDTQYAQAVADAATDATTKSNNARTAAISAAATDATTKANTAQTNAINAAATDATTKANAAQANSIADAATKYVTGSSLGQFYLNVKNYGAVGNGVANDTAAIQSAHNAAVTAGAALFFPAGDYLTGQINITTGARWFGRGKLIQLNDTDAIIYINRSSPEELVGTLTANIPMGATSISISGYAGNLSEGDNILIADDFNYDPNGTSTRSGELAEVASVTSTTITLKQKVKGAFTANKAYQTANGAYIRKVNFISGLSFEGLTFEGRLSAVAPLINAYYIRNVRFSKLTCTRAGDNFISMKISKNVSVMDFVAENLVDDLANNHNGYAVHISNTAENVYVVGGVVNNARHAVTTTGGGKGIPRNLVISNVVATGCNQAAGIDTHAAGDNVVISGCIVTSCAIGITVRSKNTTVVGNLIRQCITGIRLAETLVENCVIKDNTVEDSTYGLLSSDTNSRVYISGNSIQNCSNTMMYWTGTTAGLNIEDNNLTNGNLDGINVTSASSNILISGNTVTDIGLTTSSFSVQLVGATSGGGRCDITDNRMIARVSTLSSRAVNSARPSLIADNRTYGSFTNATKFNGASGSVIPASTAPGGNVEFA